MWTEVVNIQKKKDGVRKITLSFTSLTMKYVPTILLFEPTRRWPFYQTNKKISIVLCVFQVLQTDAYAGKMWMMGGQGNKLSRSDGIDMSLGLITTPNDLKQLKAKRKTMLGTGM